MIWTRVRHEPLLQEFDKALLAGKRSGTKSDTVAKTDENKQPYVIEKVGGGKRIRTADPLLAKQVLFQLSYTPVKKPSAGSSRFGGPR